MKHNKTHKYKTGSKKNKTKRNKNDGGSSRSKSLPPPPLPSIKSSSQRSFFPPLPPIKPNSPTPKLKSKSKSPPPKTLKNHLIAKGKYTGYLGEVLENNPNVPHGRGSMIIPPIRSDTIKQYVGNWKHGIKHDDNGILLDNVLKRDLDFPTYYIRGKWENDLQEGFHEMKKIEFFADIDTPKTKNAPGRIVYYEHGKLAGKKIEEAIENTIGKKLPDDVFRIMNSYRKPF